MDRFGRAALTFDVTDAGPADGPVVVLLHGFPQDRSCWSGVVPALVGAGFRVLAPDQRGYSPGACPSGRRAYAVAESAADVLAMLDAADVDGAHVVGHDWGAMVAWHLGARHGRRVRTLTALSVPHPRALVRAFATSSQLAHSWYMLAFQLPWLPERLLSLGGGRSLAQAMRRSGMPADAVARYGRRFSGPATLTGPLNWYRALPFGAATPLPAVDVPTLFVWSNGDVAITRAAAASCARYVTGPYRLHVLEGRSHWIPEEDPDGVAGLVLEHVAAHTASS